MPGAAPARPASHGAGHHCARGSARPARAPNRQRQRTASGPGECPRRPCSCTRCPTRPKRTHGPRSPRWTEPGARREGYLRLFGRRGAPSGGPAEGADQALRRSRLRPASAGCDDADATPACPAGRSRRAAERPRARRAPAYRHRPRPARHRQSPDRSLSTVRSHPRNIYVKLDGTSRRAAVRRPQDLNLIPGQRRADGRRTGREVHHPAHQV